MNDLHTRQPLPPVDQHFAGHNGNEAGAQAMEQLDPPFVVGHLVCVFCEGTCFVVFTEMDELLLCPFCEQHNPPPPEHKGYPKGICERCGKPVDSHQLWKTTDGKYESVCK